MVTLAGPRALSRSEHVVEGRSRVGVLYHPRIEASLALGTELVATLETRGGRATLLSAWDLDAIDDHLPDLDWMVTLGGDGTMLRAARQTAVHGVPILGVNFGRLGFLAEVEPADALERVPEVLTGAGDVERRFMLRCWADLGGSEVGPIEVVNEVFVGRGRIARAVRLETSVDGVPTVRFAGDGLIVATPTGSTAYSLSSGGPVAAPTMAVMLLTPVVPHPTPVRAMVLPGDSTVDITALVDEDAVVSIDGQIHHPVTDGDTVRITASTLQARFLRLGPREYFFRTLVERLRRW